MNNPWTTLLAGLREGDAVTRTQAAAGLKALGTEAGVVAARLLPLLGDTSESIRESLVSALEDCGPVPTTDLPAIAAQLASSTELTAYWSATLLGRGGADATFAQDVLADALTDEARPLVVRERCAWALGEIGEPTERTRAALRQCSEANSPRLARLAKTALGA